MASALQNNSNDSDGESSEDDEVDVEKVIEHLCSKYAGMGITFLAKSFENTEEHVKDVCISGRTICVICICKVKMRDQCWTCTTCYGIFHLHCIYQWCQDSIGATLLTWKCPNCRTNYRSAESPVVYNCFCRKVTDPEFQESLIPHSCGQICNKKYSCGHLCLLLCHPGSCPPCPMLISTPCICGRIPAKPFPCSVKSSCEMKCGKLLACGHNCEMMCHIGKCKPCTLDVPKSCTCNAESKLLPCGAPDWHCDQICGRKLSCGEHECMENCHQGDCNICPFLSYTCPCGKEQRSPACSNFIVCSNVCGKQLSCGQHFCTKLCHEGKCDTCEEMIDKSCRCGGQTKAFRCTDKLYCTKICKRRAICGKHVCNRKCCNGLCQEICEKHCKKMLNCLNHQCSMKCHSGPCFPCIKTKVFSCCCGETKVRRNMPCGKKFRPYCNKICKKSSNCHHENDHLCHPGQCPPCRQICEKPLDNCEHLCQSRCHELTGDCPRCQESITVVCQGQHQLIDIPCYRKIGNCQNKCGRFLKCGNHTCTLKCHFVFGAPDDVHAGENCDEECNQKCNAVRPIGCKHSCPRLCHLEPCKPCPEKIEKKCHCGSKSFPKICGEFFTVEGPKETPSCGKQCIKLFPCGHPCRAKCHSGPCPNPESCKKKVSVFCKCGRVEQKIGCDVIRNGNPTVECDEGCLNV